MAFEVKNTPFVKLVVKTKKKLFTVGRLPENPFPQLVCMHSWCRGFSDCICIGHTTTTISSKSRNFESQRLHIVGTYSQCTLQYYTYLSMLYFLPSIVCGSANFIALNAVGATKNPFTLFSLITLKKFRSKYE